MREGGKGESVGAAVPGRVFVGGTSGGCYYMSQMTLTVYIWLLFVHSNPNMGCVGAVGRCGGSVSRPVGGTDDGGSLIPRAMRR